MLAPFLKTRLISSGSELRFGEANNHLSIVVEGQIENWIPVPKSVLSIVFQELQKFVDNDYSNLYFESGSTVTLSEIIKKVKKMLVIHKKSQVRNEFYFGEPSDQEMKDYLQRELLKRQPKWATILASFK